MALGVGRGGRVVVGGGNTPTGLAMTAATVAAVARARLEMVPLIYLMLFVLPGIGEC